MKFSAAKTDEESFLALESWVKLKAVLVLPLRVSKSRTSSGRKFHQEQMRNWLAGNEDECWQKAKKVEEERQRLFKKRKKWPFNEAKSQEKHIEDAIADPLSKD